MVKATSSTVILPSDLAISASAVPPPAPVVEKAKPKRAPKKESVPVVVESMPDSTGVVENVGDASTIVAESVEKVTDASSDLTDEIAELLKTIHARSLLDVTIKMSVKSIEKKVARMTKLLEKSMKKRRSGLSKVSGFEKPTEITDDLAKFVGEPIGALVARTAISKKIHEYVKANDLQDPKNRRIIHPDAKLKKLLKISPTDELSYFNLQKYLKVHFKK